VRLPEAIDRFRSQFLSPAGWTGWSRKAMAVADGQKISARSRGAFSITVNAARRNHHRALPRAYMAADPKTYVEGTVRLCPVGYRPRLREVMRELYRVLRVWLLTKLISMAFVAVCVTIGLWLMHVPLALALGLVAGLFEFIPTHRPAAVCGPGGVDRFCAKPDDGTLRRAALLRRAMGAERGT